MGYQFLNLGMLIVIGVAFFNGLGNLWGKSINGLLGQTS
jgi:hypothetical protein